MRLGNGGESGGRADTQECAWSSTERAAVGLSFMIYLFTGVDSLQRTHRSYLSRLYGFGNG